MDGVRISPSSFYRIPLETLVRYWVYSWIGDPFRRIFSVIIYSSSTAQGGGGSFKNRKPIGEIGCCESGMAERIHWWTERCLRSPLFLSLSSSDYLFTYQPIFYVSISIYRSIYLSLSLFHPITYLPIYLYIYLSTYLPIYLSAYLPTDLSIYLDVGQNGRLRGPQMLV